MNHAVSIFHPPFGAARFGRRRSDCEPANMWLGNTILTGNFRPRTETEQLIGIVGCDAQVPWRPQDRSPDRISLTRLETAIDVRSKIRIKHVRRRSTSVSRIGGVETIN